MLFYSKPKIDIKLKIIPAITSFIMLLAPQVVAQQQESEEADNFVQTVSIKARADHDFLLAADYYPGKARSGGAIVLHDCKNNRQAYRKVAVSLASQGLHTLLIDFRGYGESVAEGFSRQEIKKNALNIVSYQSDMALLTTYWQEDLLAAYNFLNSKLAENKGISIVASGCSGAYAVALAEKILMHSMVLITPKMTYSDKERYKNLIDIPSYFVTSSQHQESNQTAQELFSWNGDKRSKMQIYKGDRYAYQLINRRKHLLTDVAHWIKFTMNE